MLCDRNLARRNNNGDSGRHIQAVAAVAARAAYVNGGGRRIDAPHARAHGLRRAGNFIGRFPPVCQFDQSGANGIIAQRAVQYLAEQRLGLIAGHAHGLRSVTVRPATRMKLASIAWPCWVAMLSG